MENDKQNLRTFVRGTYDLQKLRIQTGNRIVANFKAKLGQEPSHSEEELDAEAKKLLATIRAAYRRMTDGVVVAPKQKTFKGDEVISSFTEFCLVSQYLDLEGQETKHFRQLESILKDYPVYTEFLKGVRGCGPAMSGVIISEIDIHKARYVSSIWRYAGLDVAQDGRGRSRKAEHLVETTYVDREGEEKTKKGITFNPFLKTKLIGVLGPSFLRAGKNKYADIYGDYKHRLESHEKYKDVSKGYRHNMAMRYAVKMFLADLYVAWRPLEKLPVAPTYQEAKLGHQHAA